VHDLDPGRAPAEHDDALRQRDRLVDVVRHQDDGLVIGLDRVLQHALEIEPRLVVQRRERLVEQQDIGVHDQGADQRHALAHAAGQGFRIGVFKTGEPKALEVFAGLAFGLDAVDAAGLQAQQHVAEHGAPGKQQVLLHHVADAAAQASISSPR
jgi:hypothetical protein